MLKDLDKSKLPIEIGGLNLYLRYNLTAMRYLEEHYDNINDIMGKHIEEMATKDVLHLLRAGLIDCYFDQNKEAINAGKFDDVVPTLADLGHALSESDTSEIAMQIVQALIQSMPVPPIGEIKKKKAEASTTKVCAPRWLMWLRSRKKRSGRAH